MYNNNNNNNNNDDNFASREQHIVCQSSIWSLNHGKRPRCNTCKRIKVYEISLICLLGTTVRIKGIADALFLRMILFCGPRSYNVLAF